MLTSLEEIVEPCHTALLVVDVQNDFCAYGGLLSKMGLDLTMIDKMIPKLIKFINVTRKTGALIIYTKDTNSDWTDSPPYVEVRKRRIGDLPESRRGSWGAELYAGIEPADKEYVLEKHRHDAFIETELDLILRSHGLRTLIMTGVTTEICVESTARHGFMKDYYIVFLRDCTASTKETVHNNTLEIINNFFGIVASSEEVIEAWKAHIKK